MSMQDFGTGRAMATAGIIGANTAARMTPGQHTYVAACTALVLVGWLLLKLAGAGYDAITGYFASSDMRRAAACSEDPACAKQRRDEKLLKLSGQRASAMKTVDAMRAETGARAAAGRMQGYWANLTPRGELADVWHINGQTVTHTKAVIPHRVSYQAGFRSESGRTLMVLEDGSAFRFEPSRKPGRLDMRVYNVGEQRAGGRLAQVVRITPAEYERLRRAALKKHVPVWAQKADKVQSYAQTMQAYAS